MQLLSRYHRVDIRAHSTDIFCKLWMLIVLPLFWTAFFLLLNYPSSPTIPSLYLSSFILFYFPWIFWKMEKKPSSSPVPWISSTYEWTFWKNTRFCSQLSVWCVVTKSLKSVNSFSHFWPVPLTSYLGFVVSADLWVCLPVGLTAVYFSFSLESGSWKSSGMVESG